MPNQARKIIEIEGPLVDGKLLEEGKRGPLVSAPHPQGRGPTAASPGVFRPRAIRFYNYAADPPNGKPIGKGYGVRFKRRVPFDAYHKGLILGGLVKAMGDPKDAPAPITRAMRLQAREAKELCPVTSEELAKAAAKLAAADKAHELARVRHLIAKREMEAYEKILLELKELEDAHEEAAK